MLLPEAFEERTIGGMLPGDIAFTVPWAMWADENRVLWINANYSIDKSPHGTSHMQIKRTKTGVIVYQNTIGDQRYMPGPRPFVCDSKQDLPVESFAHSSIGILNGAFR